MTEDNNQYRDLFRKAMAAGKNRDYRKALEYLKTIVAETDEYSIALLYIGRSYHALGEYEKAIRAFKHFISASPEKDAGFLFLGRTYLALDIPEYAVVYLKKALSQGMSGPYLYGLLGLGYLRLKKSAAAVEFLEKAVIEEPENKKLYMGYVNALTVEAIKLFKMGDFDLSGQMFRFIESTGNKSILSHVYLALIERELGNLEQSLQHYDSAIELSPHDHTLRLGRIAVLDKLGQTRQAAMELEYMQKTDPQLGGIKLDIKSMGRYLAISFFQNGKYGKARYYAKRVMSTMGRDADMHIILGESSRMLGELTKAHNHFLRALDIERNNVQALYGVIMVLWAKQEYQRILQILSRIERVEADNPLIPYYRALCHSKLHFPSEETISEIMDQIRNTGPDINLLNSLANEYLKSEKYGFADKWYRKVLKIDPDNHDSLSGLIEASHGMGEEEKIISAYSNYLSVYAQDYERRKEFIQYLMDGEKYSLAIDEILKYLPYKKDSKKLQKMLAICYRKIEDYPEAIIIYRNLLREDPANEEYVLGFVYCLDKNGEVEQAVSLLEKAQSFFKPSATLLLIFGVLLYRRGDTENALSKFREVLDINPRDWRAYKNIGLVYKKKGMNSMAEKFFNHASRYQPASPGV